MTPGTGPNSAKQLLVIHLVDSYTSEPPLDPKVWVYIPNLLQTPVRRANGQFVFLDVSPGTYEVVVQSDFYLSEIFEVSTDSLDPQYPVVLAPLTPSPVYPFHDGATLLRQTIQDEQGRPVAHLPIHAEILSPSSSKGRLAQDVQPGADLIELTRLNGRVQVGSRYLLKGSSPEQDEVVTVVEAYPGVRSYRLAKGVQFAHVRGDLLMPHSATRSDPLGAAVLVFDPHVGEAFDVRLSFGEGENATVKEVRAQGGNAQSLGVISLSTQKTE